MRIFFGVCVAAGLASAAAAQQEAAPAPLEPPAERLTQEQLAELLEQADFGPGRDLVLRIRGGPEYDPAALAEALLEGGYVQDFVREDGLDVLAAAESLLERNPERFEASPLLAALAENFQLGGLGAVVAYEMFELGARSAECALETGGGPVGADRIPVISWMRFYQWADDLTDPAAPQDGSGRGVFDINSLKLFSCREQEGAEPIYSVPLLRRWVVQIADDLTLRANVPNPDGTGTLPFGLGARGRVIRLVGYYENGQLIDPRANDIRSRFYDVAWAACLDIYSMTKPPREDVWYSTAANPMFCAGSYCGGPPGVDATQ